MEGFIKALRERHLDRIAVGYAVAGWLVVQAASIALPTFDAPDWALRALIIFTILGFPIALSVGWFAAPHLYDDEQQLVQLTRSHLALGLIAALIVLVAADLAYLLSRASMSAPPAVAIAAPAQAPAKNSIAVLPFVNMSGDPAKEYFSDGISEELQNDLSNIPELRVAARTSSFAFKGKSENVRDIARILAVRSVLEGSVRESGSHFRITAQLINAIDGYHLWSESYDSDLTDVLVIQDKIAQSITTALTHKLLPQPARGIAPRMIDPMAYRTYLLGKHELGPRTKAGSEAAELLFKQATVAAPDFADGFAALALAQINVAEYHPERSDLIPSAEVALKRALELDPRNTGALSSHLDISLHKLDWPAAIADAQLMQSINPNSWAVQHEMFRFYVFLGFPDSAYAAASGAAQLDPLSFVDRVNQASVLLHDGRYGDAMVAARAALEVHDDETLGLLLLCAAAALGGDAKTAHDAEARLAAVGDAGDLQFCRFRIAAAQGRTADARAILDQIAQTFLHGGPGATDIAELYANIGDRKEAMRWLNRAYDAKEFWLVLFVNEKTVPPAFFASAEWKAFYQRPLFAEWQQAHDRVAAQFASPG